MQRQLVKMMVWTEQARSMIFQTAQALDQADRGRQLARILTPLIKFRACRDARRVTGDGMEVRGGCGYIEEWSDPRLVRDAHLGSIWEGTSNIVALDVLRAIKREGSLPVLRTHVEQKLAEARLASALSTRMSETVERVCHRAEQAAADNDESQARQVASALYHLTTAAGLMWEAEQTGLPQRRVLGQLALKHRLWRRDPLAPTSAEEAVFPALLGESKWTETSANVVLD
jgi:hypothetical protein